MKAAAEDFGEAEDEIPVGRFLEDVHAPLLPKLHHALLMAGGAKMAASVAEEAAPADF
ncbi:MAG: hypothetical protein JW943_01750 [Deltaproteobacteria bacterium]|nr:hypothetical protein [Deltaproteobacteria bacterium]